MRRHIFANGLVRLTVQQNGSSEIARYFISSIELRANNEWHLVASGMDGLEFSTSLDHSNAHTFVAVQEANGCWRISMSCTYAAWDATEVITLDPERGLVLRNQTYTFHDACDGAIHPGWQITNNPSLRYTFPLRAHETCLSGLGPLRSDVAWALPFPFHVWHEGGWVALYGLDKRTSPGTLDFVPPDEQSKAKVRVYYPDITKQPEGFNGMPQIPQFTRIESGTQLTLREVFAVQVLSPDQEPLLEAERIAASILFDKPWPARDLATVADGIADFYRHCELWEPNALGPQRGWFLNMWTYTQAGTPQRKGPGGGYFDMGWGEGIAAEIFIALVRYWRRSGRQDLLPYVNEMTHNMQLFSRSSRGADGYFDRSDGRRFGDFMLDHTPPGHRIWTHSLGHTGSQLLQAYIEGESYPEPEVRHEWLTTAQSIGAFFAQRQRADGDLQDIYDEENGELNKKAHHIAARAVVCGLWTKLAEVTGNHSHLDHAIRLARAVAHDIESYAFYNQMIDGLAAPDIEYMDGEGAYYVLEGLAPLYQATHDPFILTLCQKAAAFGFAWTYFYDLPHAHHGVARGGQCCRMPDFPLLYPIGPAKAIEPLFSLYHSTGDTFYKTMASEMVRFIGEYQWDCPGKPWHGGMIHAIDQSTGQHWGPDKCGQVDTGMATGNSLAALELWLRNSRLESR